MVREKNCGKEGWDESIVMRDGVWGRLKRVKTKMGFLGLQKILPSCQFSKQCVEKLKRANK